MLTCGAPVPAFCVSPTLFSGLPTLPLLTADIPGRALRETFRGLQQTVRLLGASDVGRVGGGGRAQAGGWGDCTPPTPHFSTGHPAGGAVDGTHRRAEGPAWADGEPPLLTALPGLPHAH